MGDVEVTKQAYAKIFQNYASRNSDLNEVVRRMLDWFISLLSGEKVLDVGCANGRESKYLFEHSLDVTGCDISEEFIQLAREKCPGCEFVVSDMRKLGKGEKYDGLWVSASFLHVPKSDARATLEGFFELLNPGGVMYVSVMKGDFDGLRPNVALNWPERHFSDYGENEIEGLLEGAGFTVIENESVKTEWGSTFLHLFCKKS